MEQRLDFHKASPAAKKALTTFDGAVGKLGLEPLLLELVKPRASQINGCAFCVDMHTAEARKMGETERQPSALPIWHGTPLFTPRERAALGWTEAITLLTSSPAPDAEYAVLRTHFRESEAVNLTLAISLINTSNRLSVGFRKTLSA